MFVFLFFIPHKALSGEELGNHRSAMVISGGLSLGVYEAGINAVVVEAAREENNMIPSIDVATGASAGAINALATAVSSCLKRGSDNPLYDNIFRDIWIDIDIKTLVPSDNDLYGTLDIGTELSLGMSPLPSIIKDSVFNRGVFDKPIQKIKQIVETGDFIEGCTKYIGLMVTKGKPDESYITLAAGNRAPVRKQSYVVPIHVVVEKRQGKNILVFKNLSSSQLKILMKNSHSIRNYISLPGKGGEDIHFSRVVRTVLASSAFPIAFARITIDYCESTRKGTSSDYCPEGLTLKRSDFIDGGYFNNVPIGAAAELLNLSSSNEQGIEGREVGNGLDYFIFIDPDKRKRALKERVNAIDDDVKKGHGMRDSGRLDLATQIGHILPGLTTLRKTSMQVDFERYFVSGSNKNKNKQRIYKPTARSAFITGNFLGAFGGFFDALFREYDYLAGIHDGLVYSGEFICEQKRPLPQNHSECVDYEYSRLLKQFLPIDKPNESNETQPSTELALALLSEFSKDDEFKGTTERKGVCNTKTPLTQSGLGAVYCAIKGSGDYPREGRGKSQSSSFEDFLDDLKARYVDIKHEEDRELNVSNTTHYMMFRKSFWVNSFIKRISNRLLFVERESKGTAEKLISAAYIMIPNDPIAPRSEGGGRFPGSNKIFYQLIPDQIGLDAAQSGMSLGWSMTPNMAIPFTQDWYFELDGSTHFQITDTQIGQNGGAYWDFGIGARKARPELAFSSYGFSFNVNRNFGDTLVHGKDYNLGAEVNIGFLSDKLRLSLGVRDIKESYPGENWTVRLMFTNIDELFWAFK